MPDQEPRHRRERPAAAAVYVLLTAAAVLVTGAAWGVSTLLTSGEPSSSKLPGAPDHTPDEQAETPGEPVGDDAGPYRMWIPRIGVRASVVTVESNDERVLMPPEDPLLAGWWNGGAAPADESGSVLVIGHAVESGDAVFNDVPSLREGDVILVTEDAPRAYRVNAVVALSPEELAEQADELFTQDGPARLVLVTCDDWDGEDFESNIVVTAEPA